MNKIYFWIYGSLLFLFLLFSYLFVDPGLFYMKAIFTGYSLDNRLMVSIIYVGLISSLFLLYIRLLTLTAAKKLGINHLKMFLIISVGVLLFSYPAILSFDIFNYIATAKVLFFYHENPYVVMPIEFIKDPMLSFMHAPNKTALYAPFWILLSGIPFFLGFGTFLITLFNFKIFIALFYVGSTYLIWKISKSVFSTLFFALNPLVIIETLVVSHNDIVMIFFGLLAFCTIFNKRFVLGFFSLFASIFIKYSTIFLLFSFAYAVTKKGLNKERVFFISALSMFVIFLLSFLREEIYPWYAIWFLSFVAFLPNKKILLLSIALSFGLMLRYIPFMLLGTHFGPTPMLKIVLTAIPVVAILIYNFKFIKE